MSFRVYAPGTQNLPFGSYGPILLDAASVEEGCGASLIDNPWVPGFQLVGLPAGTYTASVHIEFLGTTFTGTQVDIGAGTMDESESYSTGGIVGPGQVLDHSLTFTIGADGYVSVFAGPGARADIFVSLATYIEVICEAPASGLRVGPLRMRPT